MPIISAGIQGGEKPNQPRNKQKNPKQYPNSQKNSSSAISRAVDRMAILRRKSRLKLALIVHCFIHLFFYQQICFPVLSFWVLHEASLTLLLCFQGDQELWIISVFGLRHFHAFLVLRSNRSQKQKQSQFLEHPFITPGVYVMLSESLEHSAKLALTQKVTTALTL